MREEHRGWRERAGRDSDGENGKGRGTRSVGAEREREGRRRTWEGRARMGRD